MRRTALLLLAVLFAARAASAQPAPWLPDRLTEGWTATPSFVIGGLWDSNVTVRQSADPTIGEWIGLVSPRGEIDYNGRHTRFNAGYSGAFEAYRTLTELNRYDQTSRATLRRTLSRRLDMDARLSYESTPSTDRLDLGTLPFFDIGSTIFEVGSGFRLHTTEHTHLSANYRFQNVSFDRVETPQQAAYLNGGHSQTPSLTFSREFSRHISLSTEWEYTHAALEGPNNRFDIQNLIAEVSYQLNSTTSIRGGGGASHLNVAQTGVTKWGPAFRAGLAHRRQHLAVTADYDRSFVPSFSFGGLTSNQEMSFTATAPLTEGGRLTISGNTTYSHTEPVRELGLNFRLNSVWYNATVGYQISSWLRTEGFVRSMHQTSSTTLDADRTRIGIQFITSKPVRIE